MPDISAEALADMIANLDAYIDRRAADLAGPLIAKAQEEAAVEIQGALGLQQRAEDLVIELRRHLKALDRQATEYRERAQSAEAGIGRLHDRAITLTSWAHRELGREPEALTNVLSVITNLRDSLDGEAILGA